MLNITLTRWKEFTDFMTPVLVSTLVQVVFVWLRGHIAWNDWELGLCRANSPWLPRMSLFCSPWCS